MCLQIKLRQATGEELSTDGSLVTVTSPNGTLTFKADLAFASLQLEVLSLVVRLFVCILCTTKPPRLPVSNKGRIYNKGRVASWFAFAEQSAWAGSSNIVLKPPQVWETICGITLRSKVDVAAECPFGADGSACAVSAKDCASQPGTTYNNRQKACEAQSGHDSLRIVLAIVFAMVCLTLDYPRGFARAHMRVFAIPHVHWYQTKLCTQSVSSSRSFTVLVHGQLSGQAGVPRFK